MGQGLGQGLLSGCPEPGPSPQVDWPVNIVITESCLSRYSGIFSFLLQLKLMMWTLKDVCFHLKRTGKAALEPALGLWGSGRSPLTAHPSPLPSVQPWRAPRLAPCSSVSCSCSSTRCNTS